LSLSYFPVMISLMKERRSWILASGYAALAVLAANTPMLDTLGYESAALFGLTAALAAGWYSIPHMKLVSKSTTISDLFSFVRLALASGWTHALLLLIPVVVLMLNSFFVRNCSLAYGVLMFLLIPAVTVCFATSLAVLVSKLFRGWGAYAAYYCAILLLLAHPVLQVVSRPQLYAYNHLFGVFVGFSWDEAQPQFPTLLIYRASTAAYCLLFLSAAFALGPGFNASLKRRVSIVGIFMFSSLLLAGGIYFSDQLGFSNSPAHAASVLGSRHRTRNFIIHYDSASLGADRIREVGEEHEFRLHQITRELGVKWEGLIVSWIYPDIETKRRLLGTESSQIARPWAGEMHLSQDGLDGALKHELVHVVAGSFGPAPFRAPVFHYFGLTEGLAMAVEWDYGDRTLHQLAAGMKHEGLLPPLRSFITTRGFLTGAASSGYVAAGSFCRWYIDAFGIGAMIDAYSRDDLEGGAGVSLPALENGWHIFLDGVQRILPDSTLIRYMFERRSLIMKTCPRVVREMNREAGRMLEDGDPGSAALLYASSDSMAPNSAAVFGCASALAAAGRWEDLLHYCRKTLSDNRRRTSLFPLFLSYGDAAWQTGATVLADSCYRRILDERFDGILGRNARLKLASLRNRRVGGLLQSVFRCESANIRRNPGERLDSSKLAAAFAMDSGEVVVRLLYARRLMDTDPGQAVRLLLGIKGGILHYARLMQAGRLLYGSGYIENAAQRFREAEKAADVEMSKLRARDWIERCEWKSGQATPQTSGRDR